MGLKDSGLRVGFGVWGFGKDGSLSLRTVRHVAYLDFALAPPSAPQERIPTATKTKKLQRRVGVGVEGCFCWGCLWCLGFRV